ncbi:hypothetical protein Gpo141_00005227 [Globisporangium polare]
MRYGVMKTYKASTIRSWIKILVCVCAANALLSQGVDAACANTVSSGDQGVGISAIDDASCRNGGVGCFADVCRYCKTRDTIQSSNFVQCPTFVASPQSVSTSKPAPASVPVPVSAPASTPAVVAPTGTCAATVSVGDQGVGISAVTDASCKTGGGVGCRADSVCRFCKTKESTQASQFLWCNSFATFGSTASITTTPVTPTPTTAPTVAPGLAPTCASLVSSKNQAVGFSAFKDTTCTTDGTNCFANGGAGPCRYCKTKDTAQCKGVVACPGYSFPSSTPAPATATGGTLSVVTPATDACAATVSVGDQGVGISAVTDASCKTGGGVGCRADSVCRFCKTKESTQASQFLWCNSFATFGSTASITTTPVTPTPTTAPTVAPGLAPTCASLVSSKNQAVGFSAFKDTTCTTDGTNCFANGGAGPCRYCKTKDTAQCKGVVACPGYSFPSSTPAPATATGGTLSVVTPATDACAATVSVGDQGVGISAVTDASCKTAGGVGCRVDSVCRFCKTKESTQASQFLPCSSFTPAPTAATPSTPTSTAVTCASLVAAKNVALGFSAYTDATCATGNVGGCFQQAQAGACRYCKARETAQTKSFQACPGFSATPAPAVATPTPASTVDTCAATVSVGDQGVGISAVTDATCTTAGGVGCRVDSVCRFCKTKESTQASQFLPCSSFTPAPTAATPSTPTSTAVTCASLVAAKNVALGFSAYTDATCATGNVGGCFQQAQAGACRYCKATETAQTKSFQACPAAPTPNPATPTPSPAPFTPAPSSSAATPTPAATLTGPVITQGCKKTVSIGDSQMGISMVTDETCVTGLGTDNIGCDEGNCRFCKTRDTAASQHMHPCSEFPVIPNTAPTPAPNYCSPAITSAQSLGGIWSNVECTEWYKGTCYKANCPPCKFYDTTASAGLPACVTPPGPPPTPTPAPGAPAPNLCTDAVLSEIQPSLGISAMWDQTCTSADKDCVAACRFCQFYPTADSAPYRLCSSIMPLPPPPKYVPPAPGVVKPSPPDVNECSKQKWTAANEAAGIWANAQCYEKNSAGLCITVVCSPCSFYATEQSFKYPACVNGVFPYWPDDTPAPALLMATVRDAPPSDSSPASASLSSSFRIAIAAAAAVGVVSLFAVMVFGAKRMLERVVQASPAPESILTEQYNDGGGVVQQSQSRGQQPTQRQRKGKAMRNPASA